MRTLLMTMNQMKLNAEFNLALFQQHIIYSLSFLMHKYLPKNQVWFMCRLFYAHCVSVPFGCMETTFIYHKNVYEEMTEITQLKSMWATYIFKVEHKKIPQRQWCHATKSDGIQKFRSHTQNAWDHFNWWWKCVINRRRCASVNRWVIQCILK